MEGTPLVHPRLLNPGLPLQGALPVVPAFAPGRPRLKPNASTLRARFVLAIEPFLLAGWVAIYLDGSGELVHGVRIGGFGVCSDSGLVFRPPCLCMTHTRTSERRCGQPYGRSGAISLGSGRCFAPTVTWCFWA